MSVDFGVFDPAIAPHDGKEFRVWYEWQVDWNIDVPDPEPNILSQPLLAWYESMTARFPDTNRTPTDSETAIDYSFTEHFIYCSMRPKHADQAWNLAQELTNRFKLGTYQPMIDNGRDNRCIIFPDGPLPNDPSWISRIFGKNKG